MVRSRFDAQLEQLNVELIKMGALCEEAITASVSALMKYDRTVCLLYTSDAADDV